MLSMFFSAAAHAQVAGGTLSGTVSDPNGGGVPKASVVITNVATGVDREVTTNSDGFYTAVNLLPGSYQMKVTATGFNPEETTGIVMTVGAQQTLDVALHVGTISNRVEVTAETPAVQLTSSEISATVNATTVRELPLNGRSWTDLAILQPGVSAIETQPSFAQGADRGNRGFGAQVTISGARPQQNNYRLDGISLNDYANGAPGSVIGGNLGVDAIQEFSVLTSDYSAEYGKSSGGVVNAITSSGTNEFHGNAYEFLRNSALDARNFFDQGSIPPFKRNQFGGAVGGPIFKDKTFFFGDYEGIRQGKGISQLTTVPSVQARNGFLCSQPTDGSCTPNTTPITIDPNAAAFLTFWHVPNNNVSLANGDIGEYVFSGNQIVNENFFTNRIDHRFSDKDNIFGTYMFDHTTYTSPDGLNNVQFGTSTARQFVSIEETHSFTPSFTNSVRIGGNHENVNNNQSLFSLNPDASRVDLG